MRWLSQEACLYDSTHSPEALCYAVGGRLDNLARAIDQAIKRRDGIVILHNKWLGIAFAFFAVLNHARDCGDEVFHIRRGGNKSGVRPFLNCVFKRTDATITDEGCLVLAACYLSIDEASVIVLPRARGVGLRQGISFRWLG